MRLDLVMVVLACSIVCGCASTPSGTEPYDSCLVGSTHLWREVPGVSVKLQEAARGLESSAADPSNQFETRWYQDNRGRVLYCRREDGCVSEVWVFDRLEGGWLEPEHRLWVCVD